MILLSLKHPWTKVGFVMHSGRGAFVVALAVILWTSLSFAQQQVTAEKEASPLEKAIHPYTVLSTRYYHTSYQDKNEGPLTFWQVRPQIGAKIADGKFDMFYLGRYNKMANHTTVETGETDLYFMPRSYELGPVAVGGYYQQIVAAKGNPSTHVIAPNVAVSKILESNVGSFTLLAYGEFDGILSGGKQLSTYRVKRGGLDAVPAGAASTETEAVEERKGPKQNPDLYTELDMSVTYRPAANKDFSVGLTTFIKSNHNEIVLVDEEGESTSRYKQTDQTEQMFTLGYSLNKNLTLYNDFYVRQSGIYEKDLRDSAGRKEAYLNLTRLEYTMF